MSKKQQQQLLLDEENIEQTSDYNLYAFLQEERHNEIQHIVTQIGDLNSIALDINDMVTTQGTILDTIIYNIDATEANVEGAKNEVIARKDSDEGCGPNRLKRESIKILAILIIVLCIFLIGKIFLSRT